MRSASYGSGASASQKNSAAMAPPMMNAGRVSVRPKALTSSVSEMTPPKIPSSGRIISKRAARRNTRSTSERAGRLPSSR